MFSLPFVSYDSSSSSFSLSLFLHRGRTNIFLKLIEFEARTKIQVNFVISA